MAVRAHALIMGHPTRFAKCWLSHVCNDCHHQQHLHLSFPLALPDNAKRRLSLHWRSLGSLSHIASSTLSHYPNAINLPKSHYTSTAWLPSGALRSISRIYWQSSPKLPLPPTYYTHTAASHFVGEIASAHTIWSTKWLIENWKDIALCRQCYEKMATYQLLCVAGSGYWLEKQYVD